MQGETIMDVQGGSCRRRRRCCGSGSCCCLLERVDPGGGGGVWLVVSFGVDRFNSSYSIAMAVAVSISVGGGTGERSVDARDWEASTTAGGVRVGHTTLFAN